MIDGTTVVVTTTAPLARTVVVTVEGGRVVKAEGDRAAGPFEGRAANSSTPSRQRALRPASLIDSQSLGSRS